MMRQRLAVVAAAIFAFGAMSAASAATFDFSYTLPSFVPDSLVSASGVLTTTDTMVDGAYAITGITGTRTFVVDGSSDTQAITGLLTPDTAYGADDLLYASGPSLDSSGLTYTLAGGYGGDDFGGDVNVSYYNGGFVQAGYYEPIEGLTAGTFTVTPTTSVPEPGSLVLLAAGLLASGLAKRRRGEPG